MGPMLKLLARPFNVKDRERISYQNIKIIDCQETDNKYLITVNIISSKSNTIYNGKIFIDTKDTITVNTPVEVVCNCPSFKYQFETLLGLNNFLYGNMSTDKIPKKKQTIFACKHIETALNLILKLSTITAVMRRIERRF
jgi:hypothetical protein